MNCYVRHTRWLMPREIAGARISEQWDEDWQVIEVESRAVVATLKTEAEAISEKIKRGGGEEPEPIQEIHALQVG
jgi:hypothetical protein